MMYRSSDQWYFVFHFTALWTLATIAGWLSWIIGVSFPLFWIVLFPFMALCGSIPGATLGFFQWRLLRRYIPSASLWLLGIIPGSIISWLSILYTGGSVTGAAHSENGATIGLIIGLSQALVLAHWIKWRAMFWILISMLSWAISWIPYGQGSLTGGVWALANGAALAGVVSGLTTGPALIMLLSRSVTQSRQVV